MELKDPFDLSDLEVSSQARICWVFGFEDFGFCFGLMEVLGRTVAVGFVFVGFGSDVLLGVGFESDVSDCQLFIRFARIDLTFPRWICLLGGHRKLEFGF